MQRFQFPEWLESLRRQQAGPVFMRPATRGQYYREDISFPGDVTTATLSGQIRSAPDSASVLATFTISAPAYDLETNRTRWAAQLGESETAALPGDGDGDGTEFFPFEFVLQLSGALPERLFGGVFEVSGRVWRPA